MNEHKDKNHGERAHSLFSASGSEIWLNCPGSIALIQSGTCPPDVPSPYAAEGTLAHECLEMVLNDRSKMDKTVSFIRKQHGIEMAEHCKSAAEYVFQRLDETDHSELLVEQKADLSFIDSTMFGTLDIAIVQPFGKLIVADFKYGAGVAVDPDENSQLLYYALGIAHKYEYCFSEVELVVIQPRAYHESGEVVRSWTTSIETLFDWRDRFSGGVKAARKPNAKKNAGSWCRWCRGATVCEEVSTKAMKEAKITFSEAKGIQKLPDPEVLPVPNLSVLLDACARLDGWITQVRAHATHVLEKGGSIDGWKLVNKRPRTIWENEIELMDEAMDLFGDLAFKEPALITPTQLKTKLKKLGDTKGTNWVNRNSVSKSSGLTMVRDSDKRPEVVPIKEAFKTQVIDVTSSASTKTKTRGRKKKNG